ncbi:hypothetical protein Dimus_038366 [Dionaea muscipula]
MRKLNPLYGALETIRPSDPDGYSFGFFKRVWPILGTDLYATIREFFNSGQLLRQLNHASLVLFPKHANANRVEDFRPIVCCNILYKIIAKILASRLSPILDQLIAPRQATFIRGRLMCDNIFLVQELLRQYTRKRISPRCFFEIDLRKVYDSVEWSFLEDMLSYLQIPPRFIHWIMLCVSTVSYSISLNGQLFGFFKGKRGLRQGIPLSPFPFIICLEFLSRDLHRLPSCPGFSLHPKCQDLKITHLAFTDDLILLARADLPSVNMLLDCLGVFTSRSGLSVSMAKSKFFAASIDDELGAEIISISGYTRGSFPLNYLGVPLAASRITYIHFRPLLACIGTLIEGWLRKTLSYAGRLELIKAVLQGVDCFWLSIFPIPSSVIDAITRMCRCFLFGANDKNPPVSWDALSSPKKGGGLGLFHLLTWNRALLFANVWNIHRDKQSLWIQWVHHFYLKGASIWQWQPRKDALVFMKSMMHTRDELLQRMGSVPQLEAYLCRNHGPPCSDTSRFYELLRTKR